jgi:hypothetical protein
MLSRGDYIDEILEEEMHLQKKYKEISRQLEDYVDGRWKVTFHFGKVEIFDTLSRQAIFMTGEDIPKFISLLNKLEE